MLYREICKVFAWFLSALAAILLIPLGLAIYYQYFVSAHEHLQPHSTAAFAYTILCVLSIALGCYWIGRRASGKLYLREGIAIVVLTWLITPALSGLPFIFNGTLHNFNHAYFEMVSGYTTTGGSIFHAKKYDPETQQEIPYQVTFQGIFPTTYEFYGTVDPVRDPLTGKILSENIEAISKALLFWRSMTNWLGGIGIVVLFVLILPALGVGGKMLYHAEAPGPIKEGVAPRIKESAWVLLKIYLFLTVAQTALLMLTNSEMLFYDALTISFSTLATGGFSVKNLNIAAYNNVNTEIVIIIFMLLGSINFALYYYALRGKFYRFYDPEFILFLCVSLVSCSLIAFFIAGAPNSLMTGEVKGVYSATEAVRYGFFQAVSSLSSSGFATANFDLWPYPAQVVMVLLMYIGGMAGSTCGGIKLIRHYMIFRTLRHKIESIFRPQTVRLFRIGDHEIDDKTASMVLGFFVIVALLSVGFIFLHVIDGIDLETAIASVSCNINNVGFAFRMAGPTQSFAFMSDFSLLLASFQMILGRLEFYAVLAVLFPAFWQKNV